MPWSPLRVGVFSDLPTDPHVSAREVALAGTDLADSGVIPTFHCDADAIPIGDVQRALQDIGLACIDLDKSLDTEAFIRVSQHFGVPIPLRASHLQPFVEQSVVLNIRRHWNETTDPVQKPFSSDYLPLHTEESRTPMQRQPRLLMLLCIEPSADPTGGRTIIAPFDQVCAALSVDDLHVLRHLRYEDHPAAPCFLRGARTPLFAFRDLDGAPLRWQAEPGMDLGTDRINKVLGRLLAAMYQSVRYRVVWQPGMILILNNTRAFHGRTRYRSLPGVPGRHLKRIRIL